MNPNTSEFKDEAYRRCDLSTVYRLRACLSPQKQHDISQPDWSEWYGVIHQQIHGVHFHGYVAMAARREGLGQLTRLNESADDLVANGLIKIVDHFKPPIF